MTSNDSNLYFKFCRVCFVNLNSEHVGSLYRNMMVRYRRSIILGILSSCPFSQESSCVHKRTTEAWYMRSWKTQRSFGNSCRSHEVRNLKFPFTAYDKVVPSLVCRPSLGNSSMRGKSMMEDLNEIRQFDSHGGGRR